MITAYTGAIPDKAIMDKDTFANSINPYLTYIDDTFVPQVNALETNVNAKEALISPHYIAIDTVADWVGLGFPSVTSAECIVVETISDLAFITSGFTSAIVKDLNRGGTFIWSATGTSNGGTVFEGATGYWNRQYSGAVNVKWFGAKGDGIVDDTVAIQSAINILTALGGTLFLPIGTYNTSAVLNILGAINICGDGIQSTKIIGTVATAGLLRFTAQYGGINNLTLGYSVTPTSGATAIYSTSANLIADSFHITSCYIGIIVLTGPAQYFSNFFIDNYISVGISATDLNDCYFNNFILDAKNATNGALGGIHLFNKTEAIMFSNGSVLNGVYGITTDATVYSQGVRPAYNKFINVFFDSSASGNNLDKIVETSFSNCWFSAGRSGVGFDGCKLVQTDSISFNAGCNFFNCGKNGLYIASTSARTVVNSCMIDSNSITSGAGIAHGIFIEENTSDFILTSNISRNGLYTGGQQGYGIYISSGTSARYLIKDNNLAGNSTGAMVDGGTGVLSRVSDNIGYNPVGGSLITLGASPFTYYSGNTRETIYITGGTVDGVNLPSGAIYGAGTDKTVSLESGEQVTIFYSVAPVITKYRH